MLRDRRTRLLAPMLEGRTGSAPFSIAASTLRIARPSSTFLARLANSQLQRLSAALSRVGLKFTTSSVLDLPPRESERRRVSLQFLYGAEKVGDSEDGRASIAAMSIIR
jgi:hypothetical protein